VDLLNSIQQLFRGRTDVHAKAFVKDEAPEDIKYYLVKDRDTEEPVPLTERVLQAHLEGKALVGQYQLLPDSSVHWFVVDFDADDDLAVVSSEALQQLVVFQNAGLHAYVERSRSGQGYHVWGFLDEPVAAETVRRALKPLLVRGISYDRLYPVQVEISGRLPYGNLIALPFYGAHAPTGWQGKFGPGVPGGAGVFLDAAFNPIDPATFCGSVELNNRYVIEELASKAPKEPVGTAGSYDDDDEYFEPVAPGEPNPRGRPEPLLKTGVLRMISDYGCRFMAHAFLNQETLPEPQWYAAIQQMTCFSSGREAAHMISRRYPNYTREATDAKFDHALRSPPVGCRYIREHFPQLACSTCPGRAPYHVSQRNIAELVKETTEPLRRSTFEGALDRMRRRNRGELRTGVTWGTAGLDPHTRLRPKELTVVGALPSIGKTALLVDATVSLAEQGVPVLLFSMETGEEGLEDRFLARMSGVDSRAIRGEREYAGCPSPLTAGEERLVEQAAERLAALPLFFHYSASQPNTILNLIEDTVLREGIDYGEPLVVAFDYLQFGSLDADSGVTEYEKLSHLSKEFKYLTKITRHPHIVFSQLKREKEENDEPQINWFKGTGRIEADMDVGMILTGERTPGAVSKRKLTIVKQREGDAGVAVELLFHQAVSRFEPISHMTEGNVVKDLFAKDTNAFVDDS
jgi:hypothetical protein